MLVLVLVKLNGSVLLDACIQVVPAAAVFTGCCGDSPSSSINIDAARSDGHGLDERVNERTALQEAC